MFLAAVAAALVQVTALLHSTPNPTPAAATNTSLPFDIAQILQYGLLGLIFLCILFRKFLVPEWTLKSAEERHAKEVEELQSRLKETREQVAKLQDVFQDQMIPVLTRATEVNARYIDEMKRARYRKNPLSDEEA